MSRISNRSRDQKRYMHFAKHGMVPFFFRYAIYCPFKLTVIVCDSHEYIYTLLQPKLSAQRVQSGIGPWVQ